MERVLPSARQELMLSAIRRRASVKGRDVAVELKEIAAGLAVQPEREVLIERLAERRKQLASRAFPEEAGHS